MQHLELLAAATKAVGSEYKVAKLMGKPQSHISEWKNGKRSCSPEDRAELAAIAGISPAHELLMAVLEKYEGTPRGDRLKEALTKAAEAIRMGSRYPRA